MTHCREVAENVSVVLKSKVIVSTTMVYPTRACPARGIFVQRRLAAMHAILPVAVVSPQPWFPILRPMDDFKPAIDQVPLVVRPRMFYFPGVMKGMDAEFYANALRAGLREVERTHEVMGIDSHFEWPDAVGAWIVARERGWPFVCTLRGKLVSQSKDRHKRRWMTRMLLDSDGVVSVSQSLAELAQRLVGRPIEIRVIPNGVDTTVFVRREKLGEADDGVGQTARDILAWDANAKYVVSVGHVQKLKGFHRLVEVWPEVCRSGRCAVDAGGRGGE
ncbi:MAG: glycosyltransferase [Planctomycetes bacterium]|nr:glycosyltransferase [Planctomycetota bacterium]